MQKYAPDMHLICNKICKKYAGICKNMHRCIFCIFCIYMHPPLCWWQDQGSDGFQPIYSVYEDTCCQCFCLGAIASVKSESCDLGSAGLARAQAPPAVLVKLPCRLAKQVCLGWEGGSSSSRTDSEITFKLNHPSKSTWKSVKIVQNLNVLQCRGQTWKDDYFVILLLILCLFDIFDDYLSFK
jgi:hypothetical protein